MNDEITHQSVNLAIRMSKATVQALVDGLRKAKNKLEEEAKRAANKPAKEKNGEMTLKELMKQGQGVSSIPITDESMKDFKRQCNRYGVDFAIVKDKNTDPPTFTAFFKAKDADAVTQVLTEYTNKKEKEKNKESVREKIKKNKEKAAKQPRKEKHKTKERGER